jgi:chaperone modulatory protein CbpM
MNKVITGILIEETTTFTFNEVCQNYHIPKELLMDLMEYGIFNNQTTQIEQVTFDQNALRKMEIGFRLHKDLDINIAGVALALDLLEELDNMRNELRMLQKQV